MTYLLISLPFLLLAAGLAFRYRSAMPRQLVVTVGVVAVLFILTTIFDNLMIWADLFGYGDEQRLGISIGLMPIEDLFYPLVAALMIPAVWRGTGSKR